MDKIPSFSKNHDELKKGLHFCGTANSVSTWDLRFKTPNGGDYLAPASMHTTEHLIATLVRNSAHKNDIIYFGPMGCRTGYYLLTVNMDYQQVKQLLIESFSLVPDFSEVPGNKREECGNYLEHDLNAAKTDCAQYLEVLKAL